MKDTISKYNNGSEMAELELLDEIMDEFSNSLSKQEARIILHKRYGKVEKF